MHSSVKGTRDREDFIVQEKCILLRQIKLNTMGYIGLYSINISNMKITFSYNLANFNINTCHFIFKYYVINLGRGEILVGEDFDDAWGV